ncbi:hypothetical protein ACH4UM_32080 [Streptomyces sp. NPDC020801]|uniref:hypothetical protein n=1 Tax=unclassified Streptomyces TaxID=2593676 RepID=UPI0037B4E43E
MRTGLLRTLGAATAAYGLATAYRPSLLARPTGLVDADRRTEPHTALALRPLAWRDAASGLAMLLAPRGPALVTATAVRIASDLGDAYLLGTALPSRPRRLATAVMASGWAALAVAGLVGNCHAGKPAAQEADA